MVHSVEGNKKKVKTAETPKIEFEYVQVYEIHTEPAEPLNLRLWKGIWIKFPKKFKQSIN